MAEIAIRNVRDLGEDARRTLEALLGRRLAEEEQVGVTLGRRVPRLQETHEGSLQNGFPRVSERCRRGPRRSQTTNWNR